jgi:hypothetical protein
LGAEQYRELAGGIQKRLCGAIGYAQKRLALVEYHKLTELRSEVEVLLREFKEVSGKQ